MKKIEAIIREERLDVVNKALEEKSYLGIKVGELRGLILEKSIVPQTA
jgi:nitrogen regulatory protein PII